MRNGFERLATVLLLFAALTVAGVAVRRELTDLGSTTINVRMGGPPAFVSNWEELLQGDILVGSQAAPIKVVEFIEDVGEDIKK